MKVLGFITISIAFILTACGGEELSDQEKIENEVRNYLFLGDSIEVTTQTTDTISVPELNGMLSNTEENLSLIQLDIDTLSSMMDTVAYHMIDNGESFPEGFSETLSPNQIIFLQYQLKFTELQVKKRQFEQTKRILLHLQRASWADIAGYEIQVSYNVGGKQVETMVLMDGDFRVVD